MSLWDTKKKSIWDTKPKTNAVATLAVKPTAQTPARPAAPTILPNMTMSGSTAQSVAPQPMSPLLKAVADATAGPRERVGAVVESVKTRSFEPLKKSISKQIAEADTRVDPLTMEPVKEGHIGIPKLIAQGAMALSTHGSGRVNPKATPKVAPTQPVSKPTIDLPEVSSPTLAPTPQPKAPSIASLADDVTKLEANASLNVNNYNVSKQGKELLEKTVDEVRPAIEAKIGKVLTNKEALKLADNASDVLKSTVGRERTLDWQAAMLKARQKLAAAADTGKVDKDFIDTLLAVKTQSTDIARKLQSLSVGADPKQLTTKQTILEAVLDVSKNTDDILAAAKDVDFNDFRQATTFYRQFIKPKATEWIDLLRYNSMLSSPNTHIVNAFSNAMNSSLVAPVEKALTGGFDFLGSAVTGKPRTAFAGESGAYVGGYFTHIKEAAQRFGQTLKGIRAETNLDTKHIPVATTGIKGAVAKTLGVPMKVLEATDQFFTALAEGGETAALKYRAARGVNVGNIPTQAAEGAAYRLFRQDLFPDNQGVVLDAVDHLTNLIYNMRNAKNPIVSNVAKWTVPFIRTPMNIFKQGIEYSPAGYLTLVGAANKSQQLSKAVIGSAVAATAGLMLSSNRLTWSEPTSETERNAFRAAGMLPYSMKIGDKWVQYQKLPPPIAFPFAMIALLDNAKKERRADQSTVEFILSAFAKYGDFMADQSYAKSIGDLLSAMQGGESDWARVFGNLPQQVVPYRAMGGWLSRLLDDVQRKPDPDGTFIDKQVQLLMMNIPGLSDNVPARTDSGGNPIEAKNNELNSFSPVRISTEDPEKAADFGDIQQIKKLEQEATMRNDLLKDQAEDTLRELDALPKEEAARRYAEMAKTNPTLAAKVRDLKDLDTMDYSDKEKRLKSATVETRAQMLVKEFNALKTPEEKGALWDYYSEKKILTKDVKKRLKELLSQ